MKPDECIGCWSYDKDHNDVKLCLAIKTSDEKMELWSIPKCPCVECLVKPMCNDVCIDFRKERW